MVTSLRHSACVVELHFQGSFVEAAPELVCHELALHDLYRIDQHVQLLDCLAFDFVVLEQQVR